MISLVANMSVQETTSKQEARVVHIGVVHSPDGVIFSTAAGSRTVLVEQLALHLWTRAGHQLWPEDAERFNRLFELGEAEAAVILYFDCVGDRWDEEWLVTSVDALL